MVTQRNWLEVYPWTKWGGSDSLPHMEPGDTFTPSHLLLKEVNCNCHAVAFPVHSLGG